MPETLRTFKASIFQALGHATRIAIIETLRDGELPVSAIIQRVNIEPANASQHFAVLKAKNVIVSRKEGAQVFYSLRSPLLIEILDVMRRYFQAHMDDSISVLKEINETD